MSITDQMDIFSELEAIDRTECTAHLPRTFTAEVAYTANELNEAFEAWTADNGFSDRIRRSRMWNPASCEPFGTSHPHSPWVMTADLRCDHHGTQCHCIGDLLYRVYCSDCQWWTPSSCDEGEAVRAYHDHCWPGWRDLPVLIRPSLDHRPNFPADYPQEWQVPGAPIVTRRTSPGTRNVPGYSPFGGYDMTAPECLKEAS